MGRTPINIPKTFSFVTEIPIRIRDINYGGHLDNAALLSILHEARVQYFNSLGFTETDADGAGLIMTDAAINYKGEGFHGDLLSVQISATEFSTRGFTLIYKVTTRRMGKEMPIAHAQTGMLCFNYKAGKVESLPNSLKKKLTAVS